MLQTNLQQGEVDLERDRALVDRCQQGDEGAFERLYLQYRDRLYRYCLHMLHNPAEAEDAVQEAFARAWRAMPTLAGERRFYPWVSVIARNLCVDMQRKANRCAPVDDGDLDALVPPASDEQGLLIERTGEHDMLTRALGNLSERHREVLELREGRNWSYQQIASYAGVEVSTIESRLFRARRSLKEEFLQLARAEGALGVIFLPLALLRRAFARLASAARGSATAAKQVIETMSAPSGAIGGSVAALATTAVVAASVAMSGGTPNPSTASRAAVVAPVAATTLGRLVAASPAGSSGRVTPSGITSIPIVHGQRTSLREADGSSANGRGVSGNRPPSGSGGLVTGSSGVSGTVHHVVNATPPLVHVVKKILSGNPTAPVLKVLKTLVPLPVPPLPVLPLPLPLPALPLPLPLPPLPPISLTTVPLASVPLPRLSLVAGTEVPVPAVPVPAVTVPVTAAALPAVPELPVSLPPALVPPVTLSLP
jgi:RNA polymerase sigma-70 factor (ECF subfamily)